MDWIKVLLSAVAGAAATFCHQYGLIISAVVISIVIDCITGLVKSKVSAEGWDSKKATKGFWKKIALLVALAFGMLLDFFIPTMLAEIGVEIPFHLPFALIIGCYIVINECISICENLYVINPEVMPKWIINLLKIAKEDIEKIDNVEDTDDIDKTDENKK